ncbi:hypothetical protein AB4851_24755 [Burkholderia sp. 22PA0099]|uniref:OB-fold protein n=1 Tax=Burkholderia sp. 22PA0099 TaxID=3237372 RepID=UPI0039C35992
MAKTQLSKEHRTKIYIAFGLFIFGIACLYRYWDVHGYTGNGAVTQTEVDAVKDYGAAVSQPATQLQADREQLDSDITNVPPVSETITPIKDIFANYEANSLRADQLYKGQWIHMHGLVQKVENSFYGPTVELVPSDANIHKPNSSVQLTTDKSLQAKFATYVPGDTLDAWCQGFENTPFGPVFGHCRFYANWKSARATPSAAPVAASADISDADQATQFGRIYPTTFDCTKVANGSNEDTICRDPDLADKDIKLGELIRRVRAVPEFRQDRINDSLTQAWNIRAKCNNAKCLSDWYDLVNNRLSDILAEQAVKKEPQ